MLHYNSVSVTKRGCQIWIANISIKGNLQKIVSEDETYLLFVHVDYKLMRHLMTNCIELCCCNCADHIEHKQKVSAKFGVLLFDNNE